ncbi:MAG: hypothetical protein ACTSRG_07175 [Candidatus Helarchaeota archaeon]
MNKVVVSYTIWKRKLPEARELLHQVHEHAPKTIPYFTSDELGHYTSANREEYGVEKTFPRTGERGRPEKPAKVARQSWSIHRYINIKRRAKLRKSSRKSSLERKSKCLKRSENPPLVTR